jgi:DNA-binding response OmpR family regulator
MKILLIEDDVVTAQSLQELLRREGYVVEWEVNTNNACRRLIANYSLPDLIVLDLCIDDGSGGSNDGSAFLSFLQTSPSYCLIPVIVVTALDSASIDSFQKDWPAQKILRKPFEINELFEAIKTTMPAIVIT